MEIKRKLGTRIDAGTLRILRNTYPVGVKVEAIKVKGIKKGMLGNVAEILENGNISVLWSNGDKTLVEFGNESIKACIEGQCLLKKKMTAEGCDGVRCSACGWNVDVANRRIARIRSGGMVRDGLGRKHLVIKNNPG